MGFIASAAEKVKQFFRGDKERAVYNIAKSATHSPYLYSNYGMQQSFGFDSLSEYLALEQDILGKYADYEAMNEDPLVASALDIFGDDSTQQSLQLKRTVWVTSSDRQIQKLLDDLFQKTLRIDEDIWEIARGMCMYGSSFEEILLDESGVCGLNYMPTPTVRRIEGPRGELYGFIQDYRGKYGFNPSDLQNLLRLREGQITNPQFSDPFGGEANAQTPSVGLRDWEVVHFRLKGGFRRSVYGMSTLEASRHIWRRLVLLEDAALIYRLQRAPERFAIGVDVGDIPAGDVLPYLNKMKQFHKKKRFIDPATNKPNLKYEVLSGEDDFYYAVRKGAEGAHIRTLTSPNWQSVVDIELFLDKMIAGLKIPKAYLGREEGVVRASLSSIDVRFCRTVMRIQRELINGLEKVCRIHLSALNINPEQVDFEVHMTPPSALLEMGQIEAQTAKAQLSAALREHVSLYWVLQNIMGLSDEEIQGIIKQRENEMTHDIMVQMKAQAQAQMMMQTLMPQPQAPQVDPQMMAALKAQTDGNPEGGSPIQAPPPLQGQQPNQPIYSNFQYKPYSSRVKPLSEADLFRNSNKETEKRASDKLDKLLLNNRNLMDEIDEVKDFLKEISSRGSRE